MTDITEAVERLKADVAFMNEPNNLYRAAALPKDISLVLDELERLQAELDRCDLITQLMQEYGTDDKAMYKDPRYPHTPEPEKP